MQTELGVEVKNGRQLILLSLL